MYKFGNTYINEHLELDPKYQYRIVNPEIEDLTTAVKNNRYKIKSGIRMAYQKFLEALHDAQNHDESLLREICEPTFFRAAMDTIEEL